jgi:hypothetical protein
MEHCGISLTFELYVLCGPSSRDRTLEQICRASADCRSLKRSVGRDTPVVWRVIDS